MPDTTNDAKPHPTRGGHDFLGDFVANPIVGEATAGGGAVTALSLRSTIAPVQEDPGIPGPIPVLPAGSRPSSHSDPTTLRNRHRLAPTVMEGSNHAPD
jgi:hypothetical protein